MSELPWTYNQFTAALRKAGYTSIGQGCYVHKETGAKYYAWNWTDELGKEDWHRWADVRETPPTF